MFDNVCNSNGSGHGFELVLVKELLEREPILVRLNHS